MLVEELGLDYGKAKDAPADARLGEESGRRLPGQGMTIGRFTTEHTEISPGFQTEEQKKRKNKLCLAACAPSTLFMFPVLLSENPLIANKI